MKVWAVFEGSYSDRELVGVFSSIKKAEDYRRIRKALDRDVDMIEKPIGYELDKGEGGKIAILHFKNGKFESIQPYWGDEKKDVEIVTIPRGKFIDEYAVVMVYANIDKKVMIKAACDKLVEFKAAEKGLL